MSPNKENCVAQVPKWALVRYQTGEREKVLVSCVSMRTKYTDADGLQRKKRVPFEPRHVEDFCKKSKYSVSTTMGSADGRAHRYLAHIGQLAGECSVAV